MNADCPIRPSLAERGPNQHAIVSNDDLGRVDHARQQFSSKKWKPSSARGSKRSSNKSSKSKSRSKRREQRGKKENAFDEADSSMSSISFDEIAESVYSTTSAPSRIGCTSPTSPSSNGSSSKTSLPSWTQDRRLSSTAVFHRQVNRPAIMIQAVVRGMLQRSGYQELRNQKARESAAMLIQSVMRGWLCRLKVAVIRLEARLRTVQTLHEIELRGVEVSKTLEISKIYQDVYGKIDAELSRQAVIWEEHSRIIEELEQEASVLEEQNDILDRAGLILVKRNKQTTESTRSIYDEMEALEPECDTLEYERKLARREERAQREKVKKLKRALSRRKESVLIQKQDNKLYLRSITALLSHIQEHCSEKKLADETVEDARAVLRRATKRKLIRCAKLMASKFSHKKSEKV